MKKRKRKLFSLVWMCGLRSASALITSVLLVTSQVAAAVDERQPSAAEIVQPVAKSYQELQQALAGPPPKTSLTPDQIAARLDKLFPMLEQAEKEIPRDTFDPQAVIDKVGKDPKKIFEWVRDNTYFVPYRGLLRGDKGVLMDRLGNSLDRAMLLYALLGFVNQPARMVRGTLTEAQATEVLAKVRPFPSFEQRTGSARSSAGTEEFVKQYARQNHLDPARIRKALDELAAQQQPMKELVQKRVAAQAAMIAAMVGPPPANAAAEERAQQAKAITDHWWVQLQNAGKWTDFDPTLPDAQPGQTLTGMHSNVSPKAYTDVGEDLVHTVQIQVVIEVWKQGQVKEVPVLTQKLVPADLIDEPIVLRQIPVHWPQNLDLLSEKKPVETFKKTVLAETEWLPVLSIGSHRLSKYSFDEYGDLHDSTLPDYVQNVVAGKTVVHAEEQGVGVLGSAVAGMLGAHPPSPAEKPFVPGNGAQVTAEWIDYTVQRPGRPIETIRRTTFELGGAAARLVSEPAPLRKMTNTQKLDRALALLDTLEILPVAAQLSPEFILHSATENLIANQKPLREILLHNGLGESSSATRLLAELNPVTPMQLYTFVSARSRWAVNDSGTFLDQPNVFAYHKSPRMISDRLLLEEDFDLVWNDISVFPHPGATRSFFRDRLEQGVLDTNVEGVLAGEGRNATNTAVAFAESNAAAREWAIVRSQKSPLWQNVLFPDNVRAIALMDARKGYTLVLPRSFMSGCPAGCWWRIDPRTGHTLGIGDRGWGQTTVEHILNFISSREIIYVALGFAYCSACHGVHLFCLGVLGVEGGLGWLSVINEWEHGPLVLFAALILESAMIAGEGTPKHPFPCGWSEPPNAEPKGDDGPPQTPVPTPASPSDAWPPVCPPNPGATPPPQQQNAPPVACPPPSPHSPSGGQAP